MLGPLLVPPQIYAYAWELVLGPSGWWSTLSAGTPLGHAVYAGLISAGWLWPVVALIVGAGWRSTGRATYALAILDVGPVRAWFQAVLPSLRNHVIAAGCVVGSLALIEYAIPHLTLARVYATELMLLVESAVDAKMIFQLAAQVFGLVLVLMVVALIHVRASARWELIRPQEDASLGDGSGSVIGRGAWIVTGAVWLITVGMPLAAMAFSLQRSDAWAEAFSLFARQWTVVAGRGGDDRGAVGGDGGGDGGPGPGVGSILAGVGGMGGFRARGPARGGGGGGVHRGFQSGRCSGLFVRSHPVGLGVCPGGAVRGGGGAGCLVGDGAAADGAHRAGPGRRGRVRGTFWLTLCCPC